MKSLRTHLALILPLLFMMFAFEFVFITNATIKHYENIVNKDYNIIVTSTIALDEKNIKSKVSSFISMSLLDPKDLIDRLKKDVSEKNLKLLRSSLPKFYSLKLDYLPTQSELENIEKQLLSINGINKVETFAKTHNKIYSLLVLIEMILWSFLFIIILLSFVLFLKQMRIWLYEHTQRVEIMCLFGAPFWFRSFMLYKIVFLDCLIAFLILLGFFTQFYNLSIVQESLKSVDIELPPINFFIDLGIIFVATLIVSLFCVNSVMFRVKK
ncbi:MULTISPECIES: ABC transporter permease [unclassified Campylobacter]|uniref:ABC transporter permease n=1 Tax=unclassified Campylobacter TaxID=2593542 RepID=UPI00123825D6|nr:MULTISPECIES: FtsX-like permease family protein [unclassified Campylobacter]KAA6224711.1 FtsX-like permease family protein [Campylobacter sp. LR185c]KAA6225709.1 FtsX-like permease family protein [Campylobacter sp. LR286c]KAA6225829.1 FtsX-like permease family protein [Campylobacter sp. LR196d]KAA6229682.1 FtsX-like permease family protein [Campylobacter sp. LR291e]KAA6230072.1 FtsX-like permease family protein [Campylobacter sp. LR264d]